MPIEYTRFYHNEWIMGAIPLSCEERGLLISVYSWICHTRRRVPLDDAEAARSLSLNFRNYVKVKSRLIEKGKLVRYADGYGNETAEREIKRAEDACAGTTGKGCEWAAGVHPGPAERVPQRASGEGQKRRSPAHSVNEVQASDAVQSPINRQSIANRSADRGQKNPAKSTKISQDLTRVEKEREVKRSEESVRHLSCARDVQPTDGSASPVGEGPDVERCKRDLGGTAERSIEIVRQASGVYGTRAGAARWVAEALDDHGADAVRDAVRWYERCKAEGQAIRAPLAHLEASMRRFGELKGSKPRLGASKAKAPVPPNRRLDELAQRYLQEHHDAVAKRNAELRSSREPALDF